MLRHHRIVIGLIALSLVVAACGDDEAAPTTTVAPTTTAAPATTSAETSTTGSFQVPPGGVGEEWAPEFLVTFVEACSVEASEEQCQCMLEEFQNRYGFDEFMSWSFEAADDDPRIVEVIDICAR